MKRMDTGDKTSSILNVVSEVKYYTHEIFKKI